MLRLISLGSSFAAGPGIPPQVNRRAGRSAKNYPSILANLLEADEHIDLSYSGATLLNILDTPQNDSPPQIEGIPLGVEGRTIVTITAGGNDIGYVGRLMLDSFYGTWLGYPLGWMISRRLPADFEALDENALVNRFSQVVEAIRKRIPHAEIILVGYLTLLGSHVQPKENVPVTAEQVRYIQGRAELLRRAYERAALKTHCCFVDVGKQSEGHGVGSDEPWVTGHTLGGMFTGKVGWHPNQEGMEAVARMVKAQLG